MWATPERIDAMQQGFARLLRCPDAVPFADAYAVYDRLVAAYTTADRHYHNLEHIHEMLRILGKLGDQATDAQAVRLAVWFHDVVYDPRRSDNEEASAERAITDLAPLGLARDQLDRIATMIRATKHTDASVDVDGDTALLLDADLAILGAASERYDRYARCIRQEYAWVPEADYRNGRARVLQAFLDRPRIYRTANLYQVGESAARENLQRELMSLSASEPN